MAIDYFETRTLLQAVEQLVPARTFIRDKFFTDVKTFTTEAVDIDIVKGARRLAPFVHPRIGSKTVDSLGYTTKTFAPPQVAPDYFFTGQDLQKRLPGENIYSGLGPDARLAKLIGGKLAEFDEMISRTEEWMCSRALFTGQIPIVGEGYNVTVDFGVTNKETLGTKAKWSYTASDRTESPIDGLKRWKRAIIKDTGVNPTDCVMAPDAADAFMKHPDVIAYLNTLKNINMGIMQPAEMAPGVFFIARIYELGLDLYSYEEWFIDPTDGVEKSMVPSGTVVLSSDKVNFQMLYGCVIDVEQGSFAMKRVPKSWVEKKPSARVLQLLSRPLPAIVLPDGMFIGTVL
ncbi:MAG: major capsid protein [Veillonellales bacterium]